MTVLLVGYADLPEMELLADAVAERGGTAELVDVEQWPGESPLTFRPDTDEATFGTTVSLGDVTGAYVVSHHLLHPRDPRFDDRLDDETRPALNQLHEHRSLFESLCRVLERRGATVVPPLRNHDWQDRKPWQLDLYASSDLPIPATVFTNDPSEVRSFVDAHDRVIYKPVTRGGRAHELSTEDLTDERLARLSTAPVQFQEYVPGEDVRVYVIDGEVVGAMRYEREAFSFKVDQREGKTVDVHPISVPESVVDTASRAAERAGLDFAAADVRLESDGTHALLELNEAARFAGADVKADQNVAGALADHLLS